MKKKPGGKKLEGPVKKKRPRCALCRAVGKGVVPKGVDYRDFQPKPGRIVLVKFYGVTVHRVCAECWNAKKHEW